MLYCTFSNRVEVLAEALKKALWGPGADPLEERWVILPSQAMKRWLMLNMAEDSDVAMGLQFPYLDKAIKTLAKASFLSKREMSFLVEKEVEKRMEHADLQPLLAAMGIEKETLHQKGVRRALAHFCDTLGDLFGRYGLYAEKLTREWLKKPTLDWQGSLFKALFEQADYPYKVVRERRGRPLNIHIFCPSFIPKVWLQFFALFDAKIYALGTTAHVSYHDHPLLASCGQCERQFGLFLDEIEARQARVFQVPEALADQDYMTEDVFESDEPPTLLRALQASILLQNEVTRELDETMEVHSHPSKFSEVEGLYQRLGRLVLEQGIDYKDIVIMAPQISDYAPYIEAVFGHEDSRLPVQFFDAKGPSESVLVQGFLDLLSLAVCRFDKNSLEKLLYNPLLKAGFTRRESERLLKVMEEAGLQWGIDEADRSSWLNDHYGVKEAFAVPRAGSWDECFERIFQHALESDETLFWQELPLFDRWYRFYSGLKEVATLLRGREEKSLPEWTAYLKELADNYFAGGEELKIPLLGHSEERFTFASVYPRLETDLAGETESYGGHNKVEAISCCSLLPMRAVPARVICLLGLSLESFPRREVPSALDRRDETADYCPSRAALDRMLFLETLLSARDYLIMSYARKADDMQPSLLLSELMDYLSLKPIIHKAKHLSFASTQIRLAGTAKVLKKEEVTLSLLKQAFRNPLKLFYERTMGIYLKEEKPLLAATLTPYEKALWQRRVLQKPKEALVQELRKKGRLPPGPLEAIIEGQVDALYQEADKALAFFGVRRDEITTCHLVKGLQEPYREGAHLFKPAPVEGSIASVCESGMILFKEKSLAALAPEWPAWHLFGGDLLLFKGLQKLVYPKISWEALLAYYELCLSRPLPIFPTMLHALLKGESCEPENLDPYGKLYRSSGKESDLSEALPLLNSLYGDFCATHALL